MQFIHIQIFLARPVDAYAVTCSVLMVIYCCPVPSYSARRNPRTQEPLGLQALIQNNNLCFGDYSVGRVVSYNIGFFVVCFLSAGCACRSLAHCSFPPVLITDRYYRL